MPAQIAKWIRKGCLIEERPEAVKTAFVEKMECLPRRF